ncbi:MAG TPA: SIR2 family protein, partial [Nannocystis sp.]
MSSQLTDAQWNLLVARIDRGECTPFLGPGIGLGRLPLPGDLAMRWADEHGYPLEDRWNLPRVAQFLEVEKGLNWLRDELAKALAEAAPPDPDSGPDAIQLLAELPFCTYITSGWDDLLTAALRAATVERGGRRVARRPRVDFCRWRDDLRSAAMPTPFEADPHYTPSAEEPFVYHLYGQAAFPQSLVLTESDHFDLLISTARYPGTLPPPVHRALRGGALLFIGGPLTDWNFRALARSLAGADFRGLQDGTLTVHV